MAYFTLRYENTDSAKPKAEIIRKAFREKGIDLDEEVCEPDTLDPDVDVIPYFDSISITEDNVNEVLEAMEFRDGKPYLTGELGETEKRAQTYLETIAASFAYHGEDEDYGDEDQNTDMELIRRNTESEPVIQRKPVELNVEDEPLPF